VIHDQGAVTVFDHIDPAGPMWAGTGRREVAVRVSFRARFAEPPGVIVSIRMIDGDAGSNLRLDLETRDIDTDGFTLVARTWSDTRIGRLGVAWLAVGPGRDGAEESWDV
jgi:hypothetical protein